MLQPPGDTIPEPGRLEVFLGSNFNRSRAKDVKSCIYIYNILYINKHIIYILCELSLLSHHTQPWYTILAALLPSHMRMADWFKENSLRDLKILKVMLWSQQETTSIWGWYVRLIYCFRGWVIIGFTTSRDIQGKETVCGSSLHVKVVSSRVLSERANMIHLFMSDKGVQCVQLLNMYRYGSKLGY